MSNRANAGNAKRDRLAEVAVWASGLTWENVPHQVRSAASLHVLDAIGVAVRSSKLPFGRGLLDGIAASGVDARSNPRGTVIGGANCSDPRTSALVNGALIHGLEFDDTHMSSVVHGSAVVLPAAIGSIEPDDTTTELLTAYIVGWEILIRLGLLAPGGYQSRGFQTAAVCGPLGAAATSSRLKKRDDVATRNAMAISTSFAGGLMAYAADGANIKRIHLGWAAQSGIAAATLSDWGVDGATEALEGTYGFVKSFTGLDVDYGVLESLGSVWEMNNVAFKLYPCCHFIHAYIDCALELRQRLNVNSIGKLECYVHPNAIPVIGSSELGVIEARNLSSVQYNLRLCVALAACRGSVSLEGLESIDGDEEVLKFASKIEIVAAPWMEYPGSFGGFLRCYDEHGVCLDEVERKSPSATDLSEGDLEAAVMAKFHKNAQGILDDDDQRDIITHLFDPGEFRAMEWLTLLTKEA